MGIGKKIFELRTAKNLSQGDLAEILDVSRQSVSKWETDSAVPDLDKLIKLCDVFQITLDELTGRVEHSWEQTIDLKTAYDDNTDYEKEKYDTRRTIGIVLLAVGLIGVILGILFTPILVFFGIYMVVCGGLCLSMKKKFWLSVVILTIVYFLIILFAFITYICVLPSEEEYTVEEITVETISVDY